MDNQKNLTESNNKESWTDINPNFTPELQAEWEKWFQKLIDYSWQTDEKWAKKKAQNWIKVGLCSKESQFARWLENNNYIPCEEQRRHSYIIPCGEETSEHLLETKNEKQIIFNPNKKKGNYIELYTNSIKVHLLFLIITFFKLNVILFQKNTIFSTSQCRLFRFVSLIT